MAPGSWKSGKVQRVCICIQVKWSEAIQLLEWQVSNVTVVLLSRQI